jgi:hypothetical protein
LHLLTAVADCLEIRPPRERLVQPATAKAVYAACSAARRRPTRPTDVGFAAAGQHIRPVPGGGSHGMTSPVAHRHVPDLEAKRLR